MNIRKFIGVVLMCLFCVVLSTTLWACSYSDDVLVDGRATIEKLTITYNWGSQSKYAGMTPPKIELTDATAIASILAPFLDKSITEDPTTEVSVQESLSAALGTNTVEKSRSFGFIIEVTLAKKFLRKAETYKFNIGSRSYETNKKTSERKKVNENLSGCYRANKWVELTVSYDGKTLNAFDYMEKRFDELFAV